VILQQDVPPVMAFDLGRNFGFLTTLDFSGFRETINNIIDGILSSARFVSFRRTLLRCVRYVVANPSVACLSSVTLVQIFGNIFEPSNSSGTRIVCVKMLERNSTVLGDRAN